MSAAAVAVILPGTGASVELACSGVRPCCHAGGAAAAGAAAAGGGGAAGGVDWQAASASALAVTAILASMGVSSCRSRAVVRYAAGADYRESTRSPCRPPARQWGHCRCRQRAAARHPHVIAVAVVEGHGA